MRKKYLQNITNNSPHILIHHKGFESNIKGCIDVDHFHMITWHSEHPTSTHSFIMLKWMQGQGPSNYEMKFQKIFTPHGLGRYLTREPEK